ncbi:MAG TPA: hypothetical protein VHM16_08840, partial [Rubrobacteraceae bacterium]|nr:hypothetical protein [Rubrobacteraceae bacterium]
RLSRIRYRAGFRCVLQYTLRIAELDSGKERDLPVSGAMYAASGKAERTYRKLLSTNPRREIPDAWLVFDPVSFVSDLDMLVQIFPYDRRLPTLPKLAAGPTPALEKLLLGRFGEGDWLPEAWEVEPVRYRQQLSAVLVYTARARNHETGEKASRRFYVKMQREASGEDRTRRAVQRAAADILDVAQPVAYLRDLKALVLDEVPGTSLEELLLEGHDPTGTMRKIARDLAAFNQLDITPERRHTLSDQISSLERSGRLLAWACPHLSLQIDSIIATVADGLEEVRLRPTHRDLKPDHIFLNGDRTAFIDLDSFAGADPVLDPALLLARLAAMPDLLPIPRSRTRAAARAFAEEYFANVPKSWRERLHLHYSGALLEVAHGFFRRQEPGWPGKISTLVRESENSLEAMAGD